MSYQLQGLQDSVSAVVERMEEESFEITVGDFWESPEGFELHGTITNLGDEQIMVPPVRFEFVDTTGGIVTARTIAKTSLGGHAVFRFEWTSGEEQVAAWRYRVVRPLP
jgi:hypothetical protein